MCIGFDELANSETIRGFVRGNANVFAHGYSGMAQQSVNEF
jgi:hypothetical protein